MRNSGLDQSPRKWLLLISPMVARFVKEACVNYDAAKVRGHAVMREDVLTELIEKTRLLTPDEQLRLIAVLADTVRTTAIPESKPRRKWSDLRGMLPYPACGEDAQEYVSRCRRETDESRRIDCPR